MNNEDLAPGLRAEMSAITGERRPAIRHAVAAVIATDLLAELDRPPPASRLHRDRQLRASQFRLREVA